MNYLILVSVNVLALVSCSAALACEAPVPLNPSDVTRAEVVTLAQVENYVAVFDAPTTSRIQAFVGPIPQMKRYEGEVSLLYGRFDAKFEHVFQGKVPETGKVYWLPGTEGPGSTLASGKYILGLDRASKLDATKYRYLHLPPDAWVVVEKACAGAFIFMKSTETARKVGQNFNFQR